MQGTNGQQNQGNGQSKSGGLSWSQPAASPASTTNANATNAKPSQPMSAAPKPASGPTAAPKPSTASAAAARRDAANASSGSGGRLAGIFAAGIIVGFLIGWGWFALRPASAPVSDNSTNATSTGMTGETNTAANAGSSTGTATNDTTQNSQNAPAGMTDTGTVGNSSSGLTVRSQAAGSQVVIASVNVASPTWVVVYQDVSGKPGRALGAQMFFPGNKSGTIDLLKPTTAGSTYFVGENVDNGDHQLSFQDDKAVLGSDGNPVMVQFIAQ